MRESEVYVEVDMSAVAKHPLFSGWANVWGVTGNDKITAEGKLVEPSIVLCLVAGYLDKPDKKDKNKKVEVDFSGEIIEVPLHKIKRAKLLCKIEKSKLR